MFIRFLEKNSLKISPKISRIRSTEAFVLIEKYIAVEENDMLNRIPEIRGELLLMQRRNNQSRIYMIQFSFLIRFSSLEFSPCLYPQPRSRETEYDESREVLNYWRHRNRTIHLYILHKQ